LISTIIINKIIFIASEFEYYKEKETPLIPLIRETELISPLDKGGWGILKTETL